MESTRNDPSAAFWLIFIAVGNMGVAMGIAVAVATGMAVATGIAVAVATGMAVATGVSVD